MIDARTIYFVVAVVMSAFASLYETNSQKEISQESHELKPVLIANKEQTFWLLKSLLICKKETTVSFV